MTHFLARSALVAVALVVLLALPAGAQAVTFHPGVTPGEVRSTSALLWGKASGPGEVRLLVARNRDFSRGLRVFELDARASNDFTLQRRVRGLKPDRRYYFRFKKGANRSKRGTFRTAPRRGADEIIEFAFSGDTDFSPAPGQTKPYWNSGGVLRRMRAERNEFNIHLGDTIYSDSEVPGRLNPIALSVEQKWAKYKTNLGNGPLRALRRSAGFYSHWDDHEFVNDFSPRENAFSNGVNINGERLYKRGVRAFRDYSPVTYSEERGIYRSFRWGQNVELFFLDQRSFRSAKASAGGVCNNPQTGEADLAPTAPQTTRNVFGAVLPSTGLSQPVSQACLNTINDPNRTYLGADQYNRFTQAIDESSARWKIVVNELPIQQFYALPYDRWEGYEAERQKLLTFLRQNVKNVIFLTTDVHATFINDARFKTLEPGGPVNSGIYDVTVGPVATANFGLEIDDETGLDGAGALVDNAFFAPQPPGGVGMRCSIVDKFGYGQVRVTNTTLTVTSKGIDGQPLAGCAPLVLNLQQ